MKKQCILVNDWFSWRLIVDDQDISFQGGASADYFEQHYKKLGYEVSRVKIKAPNKFYSPNELRMYVRGQISDLNIVTG